MYPPLSLSQPANVHTYVKLVWTLFLCENVASKQNVLPAIRRSILSSISRRSICPVSPVCAYSMTLKSMGTVPSNSLYDYYYFGLKIKGRFLDSKKQLIVRGTLDLATGFQGKKYVYTIIIFYVQTYFPFLLTNTIEH